MVRSEVGYKRKFFLSLDFLLLLFFFLTLSLCMPLSLSQKKNEINFIQFFLSCISSISGTVTIFGCNKNDNQNISTICSLLFVNEISIYQRCFYLNHHHQQQKQRTIDTPAAFTCFCLVRSMTNANHGMCVCVSLSFCVREFVFM